MKNNIAETLYKNGSVWAVQTSTYNATDKLKAVDLDKDAEDILDIFSLGKKFLMPLEVRKNLGGIRSKVNNFLNGVGDSFMMLRGAYFIPAKNTLFAKEGLEKIKEAHIQIGRDFVKAFPQLKQDMIEKYPLLADAKWPSKEQILNKFSVRWVVFEVSQVGVTETDPADLIAAKKKFQTELNDQYEKMKNVALKEAHAAIIESCDSLAHKIFETGDKITAATIKKPKSVIEKYTHVAEWFDLDDIKQKVKELEAVIDNTNAKEVRDDWGSAKAFGDNLKKLADDIDDLSGYSKDGTVKRKIKFRKAA